MKTDFDNIYPFLKLRISQSLYVSHEQDWFENKTKLEYTIWNISKGNLYLRTNEKFYSVSCGDIVIFSPGTKYIASTDEGGCEFLYQRFDVDMGNTISILSETNIAGIIQKKYLGDACLQYCRDIHPNYTDKFKQSLDSYALFLSYFSKIIQVLKNNQLIPFSDTIDSNPKSHIWRIMSFIGEHFSEPLSIAELSKMASLSEKHFTTQFRNTVGISPKQYIIQCRMQLASELLINSDIRIQNISEKCGYPNVYSFSKAFKKYYDESPVEYRKKFVN